MEPDETTERAEFWEGVVLPVNPHFEDEGTPPINPVTAADKFVTSMGAAAQLYAEAEALAEEIANLTTEQSKIRRAVLAKNFSAMKASYSGEQLDAFIDASGTPSQVGRLTQIEDMLAPMKVRLETVRKRLKAQADLMEWVKQYLDFDKLQSRIKQANRGM